MFWTRIMLANMGIFIIWAKIFLYFSKYWYNNNVYLNVNEIIINDKVEDFNIKFEDLINLNKEILPLLDCMRKSTFLRIFKVNFDSECNFWTQNMICNFATCSVCQCDDKEIPYPWRQDSIKDKVDRDLSEKYSNFKNINSNNYIINNVNTNNKNNNLDNSNFFNSLTEKYNYNTNQWIIESEIDNQNGVFVDLLKNPETWTGYQGQKIWKAIYMENCFYNENIEDLCLEEKMFYKIISGLHSNINLHISQNYLDINKEKLKQEKLSTNIKDNKYQFNSTYFDNQINAINNENSINDVFNHLDYYTNVTLSYDRVGSHPNRIQNLFYLYSIVLASFKKAEKTLLDYSYLTGNVKEDNNLKKNMTDLINIINNSKHLNYLKNNTDFNGQLNKLFEYERINDFKMRFRNISSIIDCVGCQKCKLHGKLQIYGLATMLKILFDKNEVLLLKRNEIISYLNVFVKLNRSIDYLLKMKKEIEYSKLIVKIKAFFAVLMFIIMSICVNYYYLVIVKPKYINNKLSNNKIKNNYYKKLKTIPSNTNDKTINCKTNNNNNNNTYLDKTYLVETKENNVLKCTKHKID